MQEYYVTLRRTHAARAVCASCSCVVTGAVMRRDVIARLHQLDCFNNRFSRTSLTTHYFPAVSSVSHNRVWNRLLHIHNINSHSVRTLKHTPTASVSSLPSLTNHFQNLMKPIVTSTSSTKRPLEGVLEPQKCSRHGVSSQNVVWCYYW